MVRPRLVFAGLVTVAATAVTACSGLNPLDSVAPAAGPLPTGCVDPAVTTGAMMSFPLKYDAGKSDSVELTVTVPKPAEWGKTESAYSQEGSARAQRYVNGGPQSARARLSVKVGPYVDLSTRLDPDPAESTPEPSIHVSTEEFAVCGQPGTLIRQRPSNRVQLPDHRRGTLMVTCTCGGSERTQISVGISTSEPTHDAFASRRPGAELSSGPPGERNPSLFESDIDQILRHVAIVVTDS